MIWVARFRCSHRSGASRHALPVPTRLLLFDPELCHDSWYLLGSDEGYVLCRWVQVNLLRLDSRLHIHSRRHCEGTTTACVVDMRRGPQVASNEYHMLGYLLGGEQ